MNPAVKNGSNPQHSSGASLLARVWLPVTYESTAQCGSAELSEGEKARGAARAPEIWPNSVNVPDVPQSHFHPGSDVGLRSRERTRRVLVPHCSMLRSEWLGWAALDALAFVKDAATQRPLHVERKWSPQMEPSCLKLQKPSQALGGIFGTQSCRFRVWSSDLAYRQDCCTCILTPLNPGGSSRSCCHNTALCVTLTSAAHSTKPGLWASDSLGLLLAHSTQLPIAHIYP
ncbi:hypothetical protein SRHO_G00108470 [Serrasalmus rhombeus]